MTNIYLAFTTPRIPVFNCCCKFSISINLITLPSVCLPFQMQSHRRESSGERSSSTRGSKGSGERGERSERGERGTGYQSSKRSRADESTSLLYEQQLSRLQAAAAAGYRAGYRDMDLIPPHSRHLGQSSSLLRLQIIYFSITWLIGGKT